MNSNSKINKYKLHPTRCSSKTEKEIVQTNFCPQDDRPCSGGINQRSSPPSPPPRSFTRHRLTINAFSSKQSRSATGSSRERVVCVSLTDLVEKAARSKTRTEAGEQRAEKQERIPVDRPFSRVPDSGPCFDHCCNKGQSSAITPRLPADWTRACV